MPKKNRKSGKPVPLAVALSHFHPRNYRDYIDRVKEDLDRIYRIKPVKGSEEEERYYIQLISLPYDYADAASRIDFWFDIKKGKLILVGRLDRGDGVLRRIPFHVLEDPGGSRSLPKGKISGSGLYFVNVGVFEPVDAKEVPELSGRRRSQGADKGPARDECETCLRKERRRWEAKGRPKKGWKPKHIYKKQALAHWQKRGLTNRDFDDLWAEVFPELKGNKGPSGWCHEKDNYQWISDT